MFWIIRTGIISQLTIHFLGCMHIYHVFKVNVFHNILIGVTMAILMSISTIVSYLKEHDKNEVSIAI